MPRQWHYNAMAMSLQSQDYVTKMLGNCHYNGETMSSQFLYNALTMALQCLEKVNTMTR